MKKECEHKNWSPACRQIGDMFCGAYCKDCLSYLDNNNNTLSFPDRSHDPRGNIFERATR